MAKLKKRVSDLCPNGVEVVPLGNLMTRIREKGKSDQSVSQVYVVSNTRGMVRAEDYRENTIHSDDTSNYTIIRTGMVAYNPSRLNIGSIAMLNESVPGLVSPMYVVFKVDEKRIRRKYFEYAMKSSLVTSKINAYKEEGARFRFDYSRWNWITIPLPPLEIQDKIIEMLNVFCKMNSVLNCELEQRKLQYEYFLNRFFGKDVEELQKRSDNGEFRVCTISDLGTLTRGKRFVKADSENLTSGIPCIHYGELYTFYGTQATKSKSFVSPDISKKLRFATKGDIVIVGAGENNIDIGVGVAWFGDKDVAIHDACYTLHHNQNPRYISYYLRSNIYHDQIKKHVSEGKICAISADGIGKSLIPLPDIDEQEHIVNILDKFDRICNDTEEGLPAEINARIQQFEFYRDELLSFGQLQ